MRKSLTLAALAAATIGFLAITYAPAVTRASGDEPPATAPGHAPIHGSSAGALHLPPGVKPYESGKIKPHLTEEECGLLGGEVGDWNICLSGKVCHTADETGYDHYVCISKTN